MATNELRFRVQKAVYSALYPREANKYTWEEMKDFADAARGVHTFSYNVVKAVEDASDATLKALESTGPEINRENRNLPKR
jgi:hypothetical protein